MRDARKNSMTTTTTTEEARERGNALFKSGSYDEAIAAYDEAIAIASKANDNQSEAKARANKAACLINLNRDAMGEIARAVDLDGTYARARERMEAMVVARGSFDSAIDALDETSALRVRLKKLADARAKGNEKFKAGDQEGAKKAYGEGLAGDGATTPGAALLFCNRAACESAAGAHEKALADADEALKRDGSFVKAKMRRANALAALTRFAEADAAFTELHDALPGDASIAASLNACRSALNKPTVKAGVREIHDLAEYKRAIEKSKLVFVDFTASWCGPCKMIAPVFTSLASKFTNILFLKVDVDECQDVAGHERVSSMPTFAVYRHGKKVEGFSGADGNRLSQLCAKYAATI